MTVDTFEAFEFVLNDCFAIQFNRFMAAFAGNFCVFSFQFERRFAVIELWNFPIVETMAALAVRNSFLFKLLAMRIIVASRTIGL